MAEYLDGDGKILRKGFYYYLKDPSQLIYFTGNFHSSGFPLWIFSGDEKEYNLPSNNVEKDVSRVDSSKVKEKIKSLKQEASWLEKKLKD